MLIELTPTDVTAFRRTLLDHRDQSDTGQCAICRTSRCHAWLTAFDTLAVANQPMADMSELEEWNRVTLYGYRR